MTAIELGAYGYNKGYSLEMNPFVVGSKEAKDYNKGWKKEHKRQKQIAIKSLGWGTKHPSKP